jgi:hypothetical protein
VRRFFEIAAGLGLAWLAARAGAATAEPARPVDPPQALPPAAPIGAAYDDDAAMAPHADPVAGYTLRASLDPLAHTVTGEGKIRWKNASRVPQREIFLHLYLNAFKNDRTIFMRTPVGDFRGSGSLGAYGWIRVKRLALGDRDLWAGADKTSPGDPEDETDIRVPLPEPVAPGESIELDVAFESHLPALLFRTGHFGAFHMVAQWFPKIARLEEDGRWAHFPFHRLSEFYADFGAYDVTIDTPENVVVGATGSLASEVRDKGRIARRYVQEDVHDFAFTAWDGFREIGARTDDGVSIRVLFPPSHDAAAAAELDVARFGLRYLGQAYGRYPYRTLTIVHPPPGAEEAGGMEYPTLITTGGFWFGPWSGARMLDVLTIHELGHQWFYGLVATDEHAWPFLDEGINSYAEADALEALHPGASAVKLFDLRVAIASWNHVAAVGAQANAPIAQAASAFTSGSDYGALVYSRTAVVMETLGNVYGPDLVRRAVGRYARRHRFAHPGPADLIQAVREVVGADAAEQLRAALFDRATVDYVVGDLFSEPNEPTRGIVGDPASPSPPAATAGGFRGGVLVRRLGALRFPVDVDLIGADGTVQRVRWDANETSVRLPWHGPSALAAAVIDPEHRVLLDTDLSNNAKSRRPHALSGALLDRLSFAASAALAGVLP